MIANVAHQAYIDSPLCSGRVGFVEAAEIVTNEFTVDTVSLVSSMAAKLFVPNGRLSVTAIGEYAARPLPPFAAEDEARPR